METKQQLATLIDAYADAKRTGNDALMKMATAQLQEFFSGHDVVPTSGPDISEPSSEEQDSD
jgi:hypothetical protein